MIDRPLILPVPLPGGLDQLRLRSNFVLGRCPDLAGTAAGAGHDHDGSAPGKDFDERRGDQPVGGECRLRGGHGKRE